MFNGPD